MLRLDIQRYEWRYRQTVFDAEITKILLNDLMEKDSYENITFTINLFMQA